MASAAVAEPRRPNVAEAPRLQLARWLALLLPASLLAGALGSQLFGGLVPCEMCHWQRWPHYAAVAIAAAALLARRTTASFALVLLAAAAIALSGLIGVYHAGVELGVFEGVTACTASASGGSPADLLKEIMKTPLVRCDQVQFAFLGISLAGWNAILSIGGASAIAWLALTGRRQ